MKGWRLCRLQELIESESRGFAEVGGGHGIFVVRKGDRIYAYRNRCPHTGAPLEWQPDRFLDYDGSFIQCALHGALFGIRDGRCLRGPCAGQGLEPVEVGVEGGWIVFFDDG